MYLTVALEPFVRRESTVFFGPKKVTLESKSPHSKVLARVSRGISEPQTVKGWTSPVEPKGVSEATSSTAGQEATEVVEGDTSSRGRTGTITLALSQHSIFHKQGNRLLLRSVCSQFNRRKVI